MATDLNIINKILRDYSDEIQESISEIAKQVADEGVAKLQSEESTYQVRTGKYNKGWQQKTEVGERYVHSTISNKEYQLTHLLEYGHATRNGGRTRAFPHIAPVEKYCNEEFTRRVEEVVKESR